MQVLLDTTLLIDLLRRRSAAIKLFEGILAGATEVATSVVNMAEVYAGQRPGEEFLTAQLFSQLRVYPVTAAIAKHSGLLRNAAARKGQTILLDDMIVAATALAHGCVLHTDNRKHFKGSGVVFYDAGEN